MRSRAFRIARVLFAAALFAGLKADFARGEIPDKPETQLKADETWARGIIRGAAPIAAGDRQRFDDFFNKYQFVLLTTEANRSDIGRYRRLLRPFFIAAASGPGRDRLNELAVLRMREILASTKMPNDAKYHAMLLLAELDETGGRPAKPLPAALPLLLTGVRHPRMPSAVRVAAMVGVERHAESHAAIPLSKESQAALVKAMAEVLAMKEPSAEFTAAGHASLQNSAAKALAAVKDTSNAVAAGQVLGRILNDATLSTATRFAALRHLGELTYPANAQLDFPALAASGARLIVELYREELKRTDLPDLAYRNMRHYVAQAGYGLSGMSRAASTAQKPQVDAIRKGIADIFTAIPKEFNIEVAGDFMTDLGPLVAQLNQIAAPPTTPEAVEADSDAAAVEAEAEESATASPTAVAPR